MKKAICIFLSIVMIFTSASFAFAETKTAEIYPTIIVAGYSSSSLYLNKADGTTEQIWGVDMDKIMSLVLKRIAEIGKGLGALAFGKPEKIADTVGQAIVDLYGVMACDETGKSINDISIYSDKASETQFSYLKKEVNGEHMHEAEIMDTVKDIYNDINGDENGYDYIFSFQTDFRQNVIDCAADLDRYIDSVLEFTGASKVNIYAVSHGGEVTAAYLSLYGTKKNAVNNAVLTVPAIAGACLASDLMSEKIDFDEETLFYFIENGMMLEEDIDWLVRANQFGILDDICELIMKKYAKKVIGNWGSIWDFIPPEFYDTLKSSLSETTLNSEMIAKSDRFHYEICAEYTESFEKCRNAGINIYIVAGCSEPSVTGLREYSDAIVPVKAATGAACAPYGKRFSDGYTQKRTSCVDPSHNHLSPEMTIDASCGYSPDTTWYISGLFHGMTWKDSYSRELCCRLLFSNESLTVFSDAEYPQFKYSTNRCHAVTGTFNSSSQGYLDSSDTEFTVTNISHKYTMKLLGIRSTGAALDFDLRKPLILKPGESITVKVNGTVPPQSLTTVDITITYKQIMSPTPYGTRVLVFTLMNGEAPVYDGGYTNAYHSTAVDDALKDEYRDLLKKSGFYDLIKMIYNLLSAVLKMFGAVC